MAASRHSNPHSFSMRSRLRYIRIAALSTVSHSTTSVAHTKEEGARGAGRRVGVKGEVVCRFDNGKGTNKGDVDVALGRWDVFG